MQRLAAYLALAAIYAGSFAPFLVAEESSLHACCLRTGAHHCQGTSSEAGFHAKSDACPYSAPLSPTALFGLEAEKFNISSPATADQLLQDSSRFHSSSAIRALSARAPPGSLP
jgi:hypothetical protein